MSECATLVAEIEPELAGFISFTSYGHIEFLFTLPRLSRQGVASELFEIAYGMQRGQGIDRLTTAASLEARPFFERRGFQVVNEEIVTRSGVPLKRFLMEAHVDSNARRSSRKRLRY